MGLTQSEEKPDRGLEEGLLSTVAPEDPIKLKTAMPEDEAAFAAMGESCLCLSSLARVIIRYKRCVLLYWLVMTASLGIVAAQFMKVLSIQLDPPPGSQSEAAYILFEKHYPEFAKKSSFVGYLEAAPHVDVPIDEMAGMDSYSLELYKRLNASQPLSSYMSMSSWKELSKPLSDLGMPTGSAMPLVSKDKTAMLITWSVLLDPASVECRHWAAVAHDIFMTVTEERLGSNLTLWGTNSYSEATGQAITTARSDLERCDAFSLPLAALILFLVVESGRLLLIPGCAMAATLVGAFSSMWFVGLVTPVQAITPSLMMCLIISMTIDYSIFLLTRFHEEVHALGIIDAEEIDVKEVENAICNTMATSGATILLSGATLFAAFVFLAWFPISMIASMGVGACLTMVIMVVVNLTLCPALLAAFPSFFMKGIKGKSYAWTKRLYSIPDRLWRWTARNTTAYPNNAILLAVVVGLTALISLPVKDMKTTMDMRQAMASGSELFNTAEGINNHFGGGLAYPYEVLLIPLNPQTEVLSDEFFSNSAKLLQAMEMEVREKLPQEFPGTTFNFISYVTDHGAIPFMQMQVMCGLPAATPSPRHFPFPKVDPNRFPNFNPFNQKGHHSKKSDHHSKQPNHNSKQPNSAPAPVPHHFPAPSPIPHFQPPPFFHGNVLTSNSKEQVVPTTLTERSANVLAAAGGRKLASENQAPAQMTPAPVKGPFDPLCDFYFDSMTNSDDYKNKKPTAAYGTIISGTEPLGNDGVELLKILRESSEQLGILFGIQVAIGGTATKSLDMNAKIYEAFPMALVGTFATAALFLSIAFRSVVIPLRAIASSFLTLGASFGLCVMVYQFGILDFLQWKSVSNLYGALPWFPPVVSFFVIVGIGLDYDIFLLVRVTEFRGRGMDPQAAIQKGLMSTSGIITAAGVVMVIAFTGMMASTLQQATMFGFLMVIAVIYDTFVARTIVNPAIMSLLGYSNWWPSALANEVNEAPRLIRTGSE